MPKLCCELACSTPIHCTAGSASHDDFLPSSSWQLQVIGNKAWHICIPQDWEEEYGEECDSDVFAPDYQKCPSFIGANGCQAGVALAGELIWYPPAWHHATAHTTVWGIGITGSYTDPATCQGLADVLSHRTRLARAKTTDDSFSFAPATQLSLELTPQCLQWWEVGMVGTYSRQGHGGAGAVCQPHEQEQREGEAKELKAQFQHEDERLLADI